MTLDSYVFTNPEGAIAYLKYVSAVVMG